MVTAVNGFRAPVAMEVAIALAVSWKPLVKSKARAVTITMAKMISVAVTGATPFQGSSRARERGVPAEIKLDDSVATAFLTNNGIE